MTATIVPQNGILIRPIDERWGHITEEHNELAGRRQEILETIADPAQIFSGSYGELLAVREIESGKYVVVVYREFQHDGFVITAFLTRRVQSIRRRQILWPN